MMRVVVTIFTLALFVSSARANSIFDFLTFALIGGQEYPNCPESGATPAACVTNKKNQYVYDQEYGGRGINGDSVIFSENKLEHTLPVGWYEGKQARLDGRLFTPGNYDISLTLFGIAGIPLGSASISECSYGSVSSPVPLNDKCKVTTPHYIYEAPNTFGARTLNCAIPSASTVVNANKCWLQVGSGVYVASPIALPLCASQVDATGKITLDCLAPKNEIGTSDSYYYTSEYNGKSAPCLSSVPGAANTTSCYVPGDQVYFKVTNACTINNINTVACDVTAGNYPYNEQFGGRATTCDGVSNVTNCWFGSANKSSGIGANLIDSNIRNGINIFGVAGSYDGNPTQWGTGAPKNNGTIKGTYKDESFCGLSMKWDKVLGCIANTAHRLVPVISTDHDGEASAFYVDRTAWSNTECGTTGTVDARIANCVTQINAALTAASVVANKRNVSTWNSDGSVGNSGFGVWKLVSRVNAIGVGFVEVWRDENTKLYWSSRVSANVNWCRASGSSNNQKVPDIAENDPSNICNLQANQEQVSTQDIISACFEETGFSDNHSDIPQFSHGSVSAGKAAGKAGIHSTSASQKVFWRLPTIYDYRVAHYNGMRFVLPDMAGVNANEEWTASVYSSDRAKAWTFQSSSGQKAFKTRTLKLAARCVGRGF